MAAIRTRLNALSESELEAFAMRAYDEMRVREYLQFAFELRGKPAAEGRKRVPEVAERVGLTAPPGKLADALGIRSAAPRVGPPSLELVENGGAAGPHVGVVGSSALLLAGWRGVELALGVELHVWDDAGVGVQELARRVRAMCAACS